MTATLLRPGALEGRAAVVEGADAAGCAESGATIVAPRAERVDVLVVDIAPGPRTAAGDVAQLAALLASAAGECFSGCRFDLR